MPKSRRSFANFMNHEKIEERMQKQKITVNGKISHRWGCHHARGGAVCVHQSPPRIMSAGAFRLLSGSLMPNSSKGRSQAKSMETRYVTETNAVETYADGPPVDLQHLPSRMTTADEILREVRSVMHNLLRPKNKYAWAHGTFVPCTQHPRRLKLSTRWRNTN